MTNPISEVVKRALMPDPLMTLLEYADKHMVLPIGSPEPGQYRSDRVPFVKEILTKLSPTHPCREVCFQKPTQISATTIGMILQFGVAQLWPGALMIAFPTDSLGQSFSKDKVEPAMEAMPELLKLVPKKNARAGGNTTMWKKFPGGSWTYVGAESQTAGRSRTIRYLILDDLDGYCANMSGQGDPLQILLGRLSGPGKSKSKVYYNSTPTIAGVGINKIYNDSTQGKYFISCPLCNAQQPLVWGGKNEPRGIKFVRSESSTIDVIDVWYQCEKCKGRIEEFHKTEILKNGVWRHKYKRELEGFQISSFYAPAGWISWGDCVRQYLQAYKDKLKLMAWNNNIAGLPNEETGYTPEWSLLRQSAEPYKPWTIPTDGPGMLCCGVDTHNNNLTLVILFFGRNEECWLVWYGVIHGDPESAGVWDQLDQIMNKPIQNLKQEVFRIGSCHIDSGGQRTQCVYNYCRRRGITTQAVVGSSHANRPALGSPSTKDVLWHGKKIKSGVQLWPVGTDTCKDLIYSRLASPDTPSKYHFYEGLPDQFYLELTAEKKVTHFVDGYPKQKYIATRDNHVLDCMVYGYTAALRAGIQFVDWATAGVTTSATAATAAPNRKKQNVKVAKPPMW